MDSNTNKASHGIGSEALLKLPKPLTLQTPEHKLVFSCSQSTSTAGRFALGLSLQGTPLTLLFDNATVWALIQGRIPPVELEDVPEKLALAIVARAFQGLLDSVETLSGMRPKLQSLQSTNPPQYDLSQQVDLEIINLDGDTTTSSLGLVFDPEHLLDIQDFIDLLHHHDDPGQESHLKTELDLGYADLTQEELLNLGVNDIVFFQKYDEGMGEKLVIQKEHTYEIHREPSTTKAMVMGPWSSFDTEPEAEKTRVNLKVPCEEIDPNAFELWISGEKIDIITKFDNQISLELGCQQLALGSLVEIQGRVGLCLEEIHPTKG